MCIFARSCINSVELQKMFQSRCQDVRDQNIFLVAFFCKQCHYFTCVVLMHSSSFIELDITSTNRLCEQLHLHSTDGHHALLNADFSPRKLHTHLSFFSAILYFHLYLMVRWIFICKVDPCWTLSNHLIFEDDIIVIVLWVYPTRFGNKLAKRF